MYLKIEFEAIWISSKLILTAMSTFVFLLLIHFGIKKKLLLKK